VSPSTCGCSANPASGDGQRRLYSLETASLVEIDAWLAPYRRFWADRLDALEHHLEAEQ
jgi:hypothetical protein